MRGHGEPGRSARAVTPSDTARLEPAPDFIYVGGAGNLVFAGMDDLEPQVTTTMAVLAGSYHPVRPGKILATGTTATGIIAFYSDGRRR
jgi:hypothetical protein